MMKNKVLSLLLIMMLLVFAGCQSEAARAVDNQISAIGTITIDSGEAIENAEKALAALSEEDVASLKYQDVLIEARTTYNVLCCDNAISAIPQELELTTECNEAIQIARATYDKLVDEEKELVSNYEVLKVAENTYATLQKAAINEVVSLIDAIGTVTLDSNEKITTAKTKYNLLDAESKQQVANYKTLENASIQYTRLKDAEDLRVKKETVGKLNVKTDKVTGITWYHHPRQPYYANTRSYCLPYIGKNSSSTWLRWRLWYTGDDWVFWEKLTFVVDGTKTYKYYAYRDVTRDNGSGDVWEYVDIQVDREDRELLEAIADSTETIIRFEGDNHHYDLTVSAKDKQAIKEVLAAYDVLK